ncbi:penicillin-binding protein 2 [Fodinicurvata sp. EGI_FJ10296]|uniref:peptidoglycan D,D-transpeptidase FtsI family protein n=1 Tax=Fodinicurvata sp. EGI_FJ10296 TaxID=3231908 RepID=UPI00345132D1
MTAVHATDDLPIRRRRSMPQADSTSLSAAIDVARMRLVVTALVFTLGFLAIGLRLVDVTVLRADSPARVANLAGVAGSLGGRSDILDRNGNVLATSLPIASVFADPLMVIDPVEAAERLASVLPELNRDRLVEQLSSDRRFIWIKRGLTPAQHEAINRLGIPGVAFDREERRLYPVGNVVSHVLGYTNLDNVGIAGVEQHFDDLLASGVAPLELSLDLRIQSMVRDELHASIEDFRAIGGAAMVMDIRSGEIVSMVSLPDFDPHDRGNATDEQIFNRNTLGVYEMGSTFKIFNTAMALESGVATMTSGYDASDPIRIGRFTINDFHGEDRWLTTPEVFTFSSNIGSARMAMDVGSAYQQEFLHRLGLTTTPRFDLPEVGSPIAPSRWRDVNMMTISFGHGISVSPLQLATAVAAVVNDGIMVEPTLIRRDPEDYPEGERVLSQRTSEQMRRLLRLVVADGTGGNADVPGYFVGGKTGTAQKTGGGGYSANARLSSFVSAFPMHDPRYVVFAMLDEPQGLERTYGYATGGWTAAPLVGRIVAQMGPMVGLRPEDPEDPAILNALELDNAPNLEEQAEGQLAAFTN